MNSLLSSLPRFSSPCQDSDYYPCNYGPDGEVHNQIQHVDSPWKVFRCKHKSYQPIQRVTIVLSTEQHCVCQETCQQAYYYSSYYREHQKFCVHQLSPALHEACLIIKCLWLEQAVRGVEQCFYILTQTHMPRPSGLISSGRAKRCTYTFTESS